MSNFKDIQGQITRTSFRENESDLDPEVPCMTHKSVHRLKVLATSNVFTDPISATNGLISFKCSCDPR
jgi:hypothetical protein